MKVFIPQLFPCFVLFPDIQTVVQCLHIRRKFAKIDLSSTKLQIRLDSTKYCNNLKKKKEKLEIGKCKVKCMIQVCTESSHTVGYLFLELPLFYLKASNPRAHCGGKLVFRIRHYSLFRILIYSH